MDAIILAGGMGTRLQSVVSDVPKPLAPVNGRPFLDILMRQLQGFKRIERVVLAVGYKAEQIETRYRNVCGYGFSIDFSVELAPLGTAGALFQALPRTRSRDVLVLNGDSYIDFELQPLADMHAKLAASITMVVVEVEDTARFGSVRLDPASHRVLGFLEKSGSRGRGLINAGCYLLDRRAFERVPIERASFERDVIPQHLSSTYAHRAAGKFIDIGIPESYASAAEYLRSPGAPSDRHRDA